MDKIVIALCMLVMALRQDYTTGWSTALGVIAWAAFALTVVRLIALLVERRKRAQELR